MKKFSFIAIMALLLTGFVSCKKEDNTTNNNPGSTTSTSSIITQGSWKITYFTNNGTNGTANFNGYIFTFDPSGAVAAINGSVVTNGTWTSYNDDTQNKLKFNFGVTPPPLDALKEDWHIVEKTSVKVRMEKVGVSVTDYLTIEKI